MKLAKMNPRHSEQLRSSKINENVHLKTEKFKF